MLLELQLIHARRCSKPTCLGWLFKCDSGDASQVHLFGVRMDHCQYSIKMLKGGQQHSSGTVRGWGRTGCKQGGRLDCTKTWIFHSVTEQVPIADFCSLPIAQLLEKKESIISPWGPIHSTGEIFLALYVSLFGTKLWWGDEWGRLCTLGCGWHLTRGLFLLVPKAVEKASREDQFMKQEQSPCVLAFDFCPWVCGGATLFLPQSLEVGV